MDTKAEVVAYWDKRSKLGDMAGTQDILAKQLEMATLASCFKQGSTEKVIDMGCGNGLSSVYLKHTHPGLRIEGVDNSEGMISAAKQYAAEQGVSIRYTIGSVMDWAPPAPVHVVYTERTLVNLPTWESQRTAILNTLQWLLPGETYLMMENSQDGVEELNKLRDQLGLGPIIPPWHNRYIRDAEIEEIRQNQYGYLHSVINYSSTYYYLSRVVQAWLAKQEGKDPDYNSPINKLGIRLPAMLGIKGQGRLWVWRTKSE